MPVGRLLRRSRNAGVGGIALALAALAAALALMAAPGFARAEARTQTRTGWAEAHAALNRDFETIDAAETRFAEWQTAHPCELLADKAFFHDAAALVQLNIGRLSAKAYKRGSDRPYLSGEEMETHTRQMAHWRDIHARIQQELASFAPKCDLVAKRTEERASRRDRAASEALDAALAAARPQAARINALLATQPFSLVPPETALRFEVAEMKIDYGPWELRQVALKRAIDDAEIEIKIRRQSADEQRRRYEQAEADAEARMRTAADGERRVAALRRAAAATDPPEAMKDAEYRDIESAMRRDAARLEQILERIEALRRNPDNKDPGPIDRLLKEHDELEATQAWRQQRLAELDEKIGFAARRRAAAALVQRYDDARTPEFAELARLQKDMAAAVVERDMAMQAAARAGDAVRDAEDAYGEALLRWRKFGQGNRPLVRGVRAHDSVTYFRAEIWDPEAGLARLNREIAIVIEARRQLDTERREARKDFLKAGATASLRLEELRRGIVQSAAAQAAIEIGFMLWDVYEKFREGGAVGVIAEIAKKHVEAMYLGPPSFVDYKLDEDAFKRAKKLLWDAAPGTKRLAKTYVTGAAAKVIAADYIASWNLEQMAASEARAIWEFERRIAPTAAHAARLQLQVRYVAEARKNLRDAVAKAVFDDPSKSVLEKIRGQFWDGKRRLVGGLARSIAKDALKAVMKQLAAEFLEGAAMHEYIAAELAAQSAAHLFSAASYSYWHAVDVLDMKLALRHEILMQYDPKNHVRVPERRVFGDRVDLTIEIETADDPANQVRREMEVLLGQVRARRLDDGAPANKLRFTVSREDLARARHAGDGKLLLQILVMQ